MITVYVSIGNSDDKLSQLDWASFVEQVDRGVSTVAMLEGVRVHGRWYSLPSEPWQNACWCIEYDEALHENIEDLRQLLRACARKYRQDSIAWAVATTEFLS